MNRSGKLVGAGLYLVAVLLVTNLLTGMSTGQSACPARESGPVCTP